MLPNNAENNKNLQEALSVTQLTNICFKKCVLTKPDEGKQPKQVSPMQLASLQQTTKASEWALSYRETVCINNCARSYDELKVFLHDQVLRDYSFVRSKNRKAFEDL